jgi:hypothetical protein
MRQVAGPFFRAPTAPSSGGPAMAGMARLGAIPEVRTERCQLAWPGPGRGPLKTPAGIKESNRPFAGPCAHGFHLAPTHHALAGDADRPQVLIYWTFKGKSGRGSLASWPGSPGAASGQRPLPRGLFRIRAIVRINRGRLFRTRRGQLATIAFASGRARRL